VNDPFETMLSRRMSVPSLSRSTTMPMLAMPLGSIARTVTESSASTRGRMLW
jgi:hypothetical protein